VKFSSLSEIIQSVEQQMAVNFYDGKTAVIRKSVLKILASVIGAAVYMVMLVAKKIWNNRFVSTCDIDSLDGFGAEYALPHKPPVYSTGFVQVKSTVSKSVPSGTILFDEITKNEYQTVNDVVLNESGITRVLVVAKEPGTSSNVDAGVELSFYDIIDDVEERAKVLEKGIIGGRSVDVVINGKTEKWGESADEYRSRLQMRIQNPPHGGSISDYKQWAERFDFVSRAFVFPNYPKSNSVTVACANFTENSYPALKVAQLSEVSSYINADERRPVNADVRVLSVNPIKFEIEAFVSPFTDSVKDSVTSALKSILQGLGPNSTMTFEELRVKVLSNSVAESFRVSYVKKRANIVDSFSLTLNVPEDPDEDTTAEVINFGSEGSTISLING